MAIDTLLSNPSRQTNIVRVGDVGRDAPHIMIQCVGSRQLILFPMPVSIKSNDTPIWESSATDTTQEKAVEAYQALGQGEFDKLGVNGLGMDVLVKAGMSGDSDHALSAAKLAFHPLKELLFKGADFRKFQFQWDFVSLNKKQANSLNESIEIFHKYSLPPQSHGFMSYPSSWNVQFFPTREFLPAFMESNITNIDIDYSAAGKSVFHPENIPIKISLSLEFTEIAIHTRERVEAGFWG